MDDHVAKGMDRVIQVLINQVEYILAVEHKPTDYNPPENGVFDVKPSKACKKVVSCITAHADLLKDVVDKNTLEVFFSEVGVRLFK